MTDIFNVGLTHSQRRGLVNMLVTNFASDYFTDAEAQNLLDLLDPNGKLQRAEKAADELEANEWFGPAEDLRDGVPPETLIRRIEQMTEDDGELERALPILETLIDP